ncbi:MAG TPA: NAD-binding protein [bacterium]|nr:NAD-binding protein [bacterium]
MAEETKKEEAKKPAEAAAGKGEAAKEESPEPRVFVVGLGQTGRELIYRLMKSVPIAGVDLEPKKIEMAAGRVNTDEVKLYQKDAASRLTWEELKLSERDTVVATTRRDDVNLEVGRIARENFGVKRLMALMHSSRRQEDYEAAGIETVSRANVLASFLEARVLRDRRTAMNIGLGQGEIMEVPILAGSPVIGRPLSTFHARPWLVGAIYRKDRLVVPHGHTVIREGDRVVLIGEPHILSGIADFFRMGDPEFPLQYGPRIGVLAGPVKGKAYEALLSEANYLARTSKATSMAILSMPGKPEPDVDAAEKICGGTGLTCEPAFLPDEADKPWPRQLQKQDFGCLALGLDKLGIIKRLGLRRSLLLRVLAESEYPVLVARGSHPYEKILVPVEVNSSPFLVAELAINIARLLHARLDAITVTEPAFAAGKEAVEEQKKILDHVVEHSALYRHPVNIVHREGNPIQEIVAQAKGYNLVVMGYRKKRRFRLQFDLALEILARLTCSVMLLPYGEDEK